jgi:hypothetical protein
MCADAARRPCDRRGDLRESSLLEQDLNNLPRLREWYRLPYLGGSVEAALPAGSDESVRQELLATGYLRPREAADTITVRAAIRKDSATAAASSTSSSCGGGRSLYPLASPMRAGATGATHAAKSRAPASPHWADRPAILQLERAAEAAALAATGYTRDYVSQRRPWGERMVELGDGGAAKVSAAQNAWRGREAALYTAAREHHLAAAAHAAATDIMGASHTSAYFGSGPPRPQ